ncbi:MAG: ABC transporter substrate-binding protein [Prolixibacteraceae bacterium]|nr:ABC transporter substrate-binding protein [Prolixibacteraceae bacterium]
MCNKILLWITLIFLLGSCSRKSDKSSYTIAPLKGPSSMGMICLIDSLAVTDAGNIKVKITDEPIQVRKMMLDGDADFAILPTTMAAILYNKGLDYKLIAIPVWGTLYLFGNDTTISNWGDLKGRTVHVMARGMTPDVLFRNLLIMNGVKPDQDITLDYSFPTHIDLANAVAAGRAELAVISEPLVSLVMKKNRNVRPVFDLNMEWEKLQGIPMAQTAFIVKGSLIRDNPQLVEQVIKAYENSSLRVNNNTQNAAELIVKYGILPDIEVALQSIPRSNLHFVRANTVKAEINAYLKVFYDMNPEIIGGKLPDENFIY